MKHGNLNIREVGQKKMILTDVRDENCNGIHFRVSFPMVSIQSTGGPLGWDESECEMTIGYVKWLGPDEYVGLDGWHEVIDPRVGGLGHAIESIVEAWRTESLFG